MGGAGWFRELQRNCPMTISFALVDHAVLQADATGSHSQKPSSVCAGFASADATAFAVVRKGCQGHLHDHALLRQDGRMSGAGWFRESQWNGQTAISLSLVDDDMLQAGATGFQGYKPFAAFTGFTRADCIGGCGCCESASWG